MKEISLADIVTLVQVEDSLSNPITIDNKKFSIRGIKPVPSPEGREILIKQCVTLSDLFFLEAPKTFADVIRRAYDYKLDIQFRLEEV